MDIKEYIRDLINSKGLSSEDVAKLFTDALNEIEEEEEAKNKTVYNDIKSSYWHLVDFDSLNFYDIGDIAAGIVCQEHSDWTNEQVTRFADMVDEYIDIAIDLVNGANPVDLLLNKLGEI